jgi:hypothetical protein
MPAGPTPTERRAGRNVNRLCRLIHWTGPVLPTGTGSGRPLAQPAGSSRRSKAVDAAGPRPNARRTSTRFLTPKRAPLIAKRRLSNRTKILNYRMNFDRSNLIRPFSKKALFHNGITKNRANSGLFVALRRVHTGPFTSISAFSGTETGTVIVTFLLTQTPLPKLACSRRRASRNRSRTRKDPARAGSRLENFGHRRHGFPFARASCSRAVPARN